MRKTLLLPAVLALGLARPAGAQTLSPLGVWVNPENKTATFEIYQCGDALCGRIATAVNDPATGQPRRDAHNPDAKLRGRPQTGAVFMQHFRYAADNKWDDGKIYNFDDGKIYSGYLKMEQANQLIVKGYIGFSVIGKSQTWTRLK